MGILCMGFPFISMLPDCGSYSLKSKLVNVDFPEPDSPTNATFSFFLTSKLNFLNTGIDLFGYSNVIFVNFKLAPSYSFKSNSLSSEIKEGASPYFLIIYY